MYAMNVLQSFVYTGQQYPGIVGKMIKRIERQEAARSPGSAGYQPLHREHCAKAPPGNEQSIPSFGIGVQCATQLMSRSETSGSEELLEQIVES